MAGRYHLEVFGCQMNVADGELLAGILEGAGWQRACDPQEADLWVVNTCAVRERAVERVVGHVSSLTPWKRSRPGRRIALVGCLARFAGDDLARTLPEVDLLIGPDGYRRLPALLQPGTPSPTLQIASDRGELYEGITPRRPHGVNAWITIMRGCDRQCAYCVVPFTRGPERSLAAEGVLDAARSAVAQGSTMITLLGQTVTSYRDGSADFADLLERLAGLEGLRRIRFLAPHPSDFTPRLLATIAAQPRIARQLHLPLQSGSDRVLAGMRRGYTRDTYLDLIAAARRAVPGLAVTTDIIVGFPGEGEADLAATLEVMRAVRFDQAFTFAYSARRGTPAERDLEDVVPRDEKRARLQAVIALQQEHSRERHAACVGRTLAVLVEGPARAPQGYWFGRSEDFKDTVFSSVELLCPGDVVPVAITAATSHTLQGTHAPARVPGS